MNNNGVPVVKDLVLIGGGHTHVIVLKRFGMERVPGVRVTVIARDIHTPYSGMLPGLIAGHYSFDDVHIDLGPLTRFAGARLYHDEAVGLDLANRTVMCRSRPPVSYDVLSIDIGVTPIMRVAGAADHAVPVKPISTLVDRWERLKTRVAEASRAIHVGVVGAGAAGVELTLAVQHALLQQRADVGLPHRELTFHLFSTTDSVLPTHNRRVRAKFSRVLRDRGVEVHTGVRIVSVGPDVVEADDGSKHAMDEVIWATEAGAQTWPGAAGLDVDDRGFIRVADTLQATSHPSVFAAGDTAAVVGHAREKAGVFAVRQGPPLDTNLRHALRGEPLEPFRPQRQFLSLVSTGDRYAVGSRGGWAVEGRWVWTWKDWIDRRFMTRFSDLPVMAEGGRDVALEQLASPDVVRQLSSRAMRCAGCGSKVGATVLDRVLSRLSPVKRDDVMVGLDTREDASIERVPAGMVVVRTVDAFPAIVDDPYLFGRITANHCLGDIYAMGAEPQTALAIVTLPLDAEDKMETLLEELLTGAVQMLNEAKTALVGGHTTEGADLTLGLALSGFGDPEQLLRKGGMRPGDRLILTKPLGTGTLFAAQMRLKAKGRWIAAAVDSMLVTSRAAVASLRTHGATACTDITGFGLVGHLLELTRASGVDARIMLSSVPLLDGVRETLAAGLFSSLHPDNVRLGRAIADSGGAAADPVYPVIFDPQTAGGLLASVPVDRAEACLNDLRTGGYAHAEIIGTVETRGQQETQIRVDA